MADLDLSQEMYERNAKKGEKLRNVIVFRDKSCLQTIILAINFMKDFTLKQDTEIEKTTNSAPDQDGPSRNVLSLPNGESMFTIDRNVVLMNQ